MVNELLKMSHLLSPYVIGAEGNVSCKVDNTFYIKGSGKSLSTLCKEDLVLCDMIGNIYPSYNVSENKPSIETGFHAWLLSNLDINFVAHTHPTNTLKILCSKEIYNFSKFRFFPDQVVFNGSESCVVEYYHPGDELLNGIKISVNEYLSKHGYPPKIILLKNHGVITFGKNISECILSTEMCEKSAEVFLGSLFSPDYLSEDDVNKIINDNKEKYRQQNYK
jgi:ribulose-5-phosphate 4-epimerase/fuculose-1-phosphate aldolase